MANNRADGKGIHDGHRDRMREKFRKTGFEGMHPHEMLEMLLFYSVPRKDTNEMAHQLISRFGSLAGVLEATADQLVNVGGISQNSATLIKMIIPFYREYRRERSATTHLMNSDECGEYLVDYYSGMTNERVTVMCLDGRCRLLCLETVCDGDSANVVMNSRKLVEIVMKYPMTTAVIISHNHPGGIALPSREDISATENLHRVLGTMGINLVDHIIVADRDYVSMASSSGFNDIFNI